jgi:hypothetical protein
MARLKCVVCGKPVRKNEVTLGIPCHDRGGEDCAEILAYKLTGTLPLVTMSPQEFDDEGISDEDKELLKDPKNVLTIARAMRDHFWDNIMDGQYSEALQEGVATLEELRIRNTPPNMLPTLIGTIENERNVEILEQLLKGE